MEKATLTVKDVIDAHAVRIRPSGAHWFIDMHVTMNGDVTLNEAHAATISIEKVIMGVFPSSDVTVHVEPADVGKTKQEA